MYTCKTYDELEKIVNDWLNGDSDEQEYSAPSSGDSASKPSSDSPSSSDSGSSKAKYKSLDEAFADLEDL